MVPKFRAWSKEQKFMMPVENIHFKYKLINENGVWRMFDEIELMQSTGLTDKNGIEIFEGDIVRYTSSIMAKNEWHKKITRYGSALVMASFDDKTRDSAELLNLLSIHKGIEVLGNIYQNPELLGSDDS